MESSCRLASSAHVAHAVVGLRRRSALRAALAIALASTMSVRSALAAPPTGRACKAPLDGMGLNSDPFAIAPAEFCCAYPRSDTCSTPESHEECRSNGHKWIVRRPAHFAPKAPDLLRYEEAISKATPLVQNAVLAAQLRSLAVKTKATAAAVQKDAADADARLALLTEREQYFSVAGYMIKDHKNNLYEFAFITVVPACLGSVCDAPPTMAAGRHALLTATRTAFHSQGRFSIWVKEVPRERIETINGFQESWEHFIEVSPDVARSLDERIHRQRGDRAIANEALESATKEASAERTKALAALVRAGLLCPTAGARAPARGRWIAGEHTALDTKTDLSWQLSSDEFLDWMPAKAYCQSLDLEGRGWRLPSDGELEAIRGDDLRLPKIFPDRSLLHHLRVNRYWSSTSSGNQAISIPFGEGEGSRRWEETGYGRNDNAVRCVRDPPDELAEQQQGAALAGPDENSFEDVLADATKKTVSLASLKTLSLEAVAQCGRVGVSARAGCSRRRAEALAKLKALKGFYVAPPISLTGTQVGDYDARTKTVAFRFRPVVAPYEEYLYWEQAPFRVTTDPKATSESPAQSLRQPRPSLHRRDADLIAKVGGKTRADYLFRWQDKLQARGVFQIESISIARTQVDDMPEQVVVKVDRRGIQLTMEIEGAEWMLSVPPSRVGRAMP